VKEIGKAIRLIRTLLGESATDVCERAGISRAMLTEIEKGKKMPSLAMLTTIASALEMPVYNLALIGEYIAKNNLNEKRLRQTALRAVIAKVRT